MSAPLTAPLATVHAVSHLALEVSDLERSIAFYEDALGLDIFLDDRANRQQPNIKGLIGGFAIEIAQRVDGPEATTSGARFHNAPNPPCLSFAITDAQSAFTRFKDAGYTDTEALCDIQGAKMFFVTDPDGHRFELIQFPAGMGTLADLAPLLRSST